MSRWVNFLKATVLNGVLLAVIIGLISFSGKRQEERICKKVYISVDNELHNYFIGKRDVETLMTKDGEAKILGAANRDIELKNLELRIKSHKFVNDAEVHRDLAGNLNVSIQQNRPIARLILPESDQYLDAQGQLLPLSDRYTARVLPVFVTAPFNLSTEFLQSEAGKPYLSLLTYLDSSAFWKAQLSLAQIDENGKVSFLPQVGHQRIEFGKPENMEEKFRKLLLFYKQVAPNVGWQTYNRINVEYDQQIICE